MAADCVVTVCAVVINAVSAPVVSFAVDSAKMAVLVAVSSISVVVSLSPVCVTT